MIIQEIHGEILLLNNLMNKTKKTVFYIKIFSAILLGIFFVNVLNKEIFIAGTPRIRQDVGVRFIASLKQLTSIPSEFIARLRNNKSTPTSQNLANVPYHMVSKGVYAKETGVTSVKLYKENEVQWLVYTFQFKGKTYKIRYAAGDSPPNPQLLEKIFNK